jgi:hypothetical protein
MLNRTVFHEEKTVERIVTGQTHPIFGAIPDKGCIPLPDTKTGTFSTDNTDTSGGTLVRGTNTLFLTEVIAGTTHLYFNGAVRLVKRVISDVILELEYKFPASVTSQIVSIPKHGYYRQIYAESSGTNQSAILQEAPFRPGKNFLNGGAPVSYNVFESGSDAEITFTLSR